MNVAYLDNVSDQFKKSPFWDFIGMEVKQCEEGNVELYVPYKKEFDNIRSTIHGGIYMAVLDTTMGFLCRTNGYSDVITIQMNTQFLKPVVEGAISSTASIISKSRNTMLVEGKLFDEEGELIAFSTATFKVTKD